MRSKFLLCSILTCLSMTSFNVATAAIPQRGVQYDRVVPGEASRAAPMRRQPPHSAPAPAREPAKRCKSKSSNWNFNLDFGFLLPACRSVVCCPPPPPPVCEIHHHHVVCPPPVCARVEPGCALTRHTEREIDLTFGACNDQKRLGLDGVYPNLKKIKLGAYSEEFILRADGIYPELHKVKIDTDGDCERLTLNLTGDFARIDTCDIFGRCKNLELDLRGRWGQNCTFKVHKGKGTARIRLPSYAGVVIKMTDNAQIIPTDQLWTRPAFSGVEYTNRAYGQSPVTLTIDLTQFKGQVIVE